MAGNVIAPHVAPMIGALTAPIAECLTVGS